MNIIAAISNFIKRGKTVPDLTQNRQKKAGPHDTPKDGNIKPVGSASGFEFLDGMSTGTARFIIDREVDAAILEKYSIKELENKGRYYLAKIVDQNGGVADTVLIDKLNRAIHFQKTKRR